jgi:4-hydroxybenzoate polyprenyltransferase
VGHPLGRLALLHPFPSALNAGLVAVLASVSGAPTAVTMALALAMAGFQVSIGALNDLVDAPADAQTKPGKPIPAGLVSRRTAWLVVAGGAATGALLSAAVAPVTLALAVAGYACGVAYDLWLKRRGVGWVAFTVAFPLLLLFAW